ncbi:MAG: RDD family protein, partial [Elusimicrobiota bacterium]|nr:RDD family protein [Elusimicrobiota bacterium]
MQCSKCKTVNPDDANFCKACGTNLNPALTGILSDKFAGFWIRAVSFIVDFFVLVILAIIARFSMGIIVGFLISTFLNIKPDTAPKSLWDAVIFTIIVASIIVVIFLGFFYELWMHVRFGQTIGKIFTGIRVVTLQDGPLPYKLSLLRCLGKILNCLTLGAGFISTAFHPQKRALHDLIANTKVLYLK